MIHEAAAHGLMVSGEAGAYQVVLIGVLIRVENVMDAENVLTLRRCGFDTHR